LWGLTVHSVEEDIRARSLAIARAGTAVKMFDAVVKLAERAVKAGDEETVAVLLPRIAAAEAKADASLAAAA
jgi:hypothetical protein